MSKINALLRDERGASMVEYSILIGIITAAAIVSIILLAARLQPPGRHSILRGPRRRLVTPCVEFKALAGFAGALNSTTLIENVSCASGQSSC